ncbi:MAG: GNAT family N-acetyltransferase [Lachnospiraceae bacterium]|nr:GNAT family N-acetyltransferase [Lachnospiraceae bacterium]
MEYLKEMEYLFETEHLKIRRFELEDVERLYEIHLDEEVKQWFPNECYADVQETREAVEFYRDCVNGRHLPYVLAVELRETGELAGDTGVSEVEGNSREVEIGYVMCRKYRGNGYATELIKAMSAFIAETFETDTIYGRVVHGNTASARVLEKSGYEFVGEEFGAEDDPYGNGMLVYKKG